MAAATFLGFYLIVAQFAGVDLAVHAVRRADGLGARRLRSSRSCRSSPARSPCRARWPRRSRSGPCWPSSSPTTSPASSAAPSPTTALVIRFFQKQGLQVAVAASSGRDELAGRRHRAGRPRHHRPAAHQHHFVPSSVGRRRAPGSIILIAIVVDRRGGRHRRCSIPSCGPLLRRTVGPQVAAARAEPPRASSPTPRKAVMIFGGNLCSQVAYALVLDAALHAYGASLPLADLIVINSLASLARRRGAGPGRDGRHRGRPHRRHDRRRRPAVDRRRGHLHGPPLHRLPPPIWGWVALQWLRTPRLRVATRSTFACWVATSTVDIFRYRNMMLGMARTPTTTDAFNAVAEASRRDLLDALGAGEATVGELVDRLGLSQPQVSKHLGVLRAVGLVLVRVDGRHRWYRVNGPALQAHPRLGAHVRAHLEHPPRPARRPARRAPEPRRTNHEQQPHRQQPPRLRRHHPAVRHRDPHHPRLRRPGRARSSRPARRPSSCKRWWGFETVGVARLRDRPAGRAASGATSSASATWRSASTASTARSTGPHRLVSTEVYEGMPDPDGRRRSTS